MFPAVMSAVSRQPLVSAPSGITSSAGRQLPKGGGLHPVTDPWQVLRPGHLGPTQDNSAAIAHTSKTESLGRGHSSLLSLGVSEQRKKFQVHPNMAHNSSFPYPPTRNRFTVISWCRCLKPKCQNLSLLAHIFSVLV